MHGVDTSYSHGTLIC